MSTNEVNAIAPESNLSFWFQLLDLVRVRILRSAVNEFPSRTGRSVKKQKKNCMPSTMKMNKATKNE